MRAGPVVVRLFLLLLVVVRLRLFLFVGHGCFGFRCPTLFQETPGTGTPPANRCGNFRSLPRIFLRLFLL